MRKYGLPKKRILRGKKAFQRVFAEGRRVRGKFVDAFYLGGVPGRKFGFAVSRRITGKVARNRAKRRIREAFRLNQWGFLGNGHWVFVARPDVLGARWEELLEDFRNIAESVVGRETDRGPVGPESGADID